MNRPSNILPFPVDYAPNEAWSHDDEEGVSEYLAELRASARKWLTIFFAIAVVYGLLVGAMVLS